MLEESSPMESGKDPEGLKLTWTQKVNKQALKVIVKPTEHTEQRLNFD